MAEQLWLLDITDASEEVREAMALVVATGHAKQLDRGQAIEQMLGRLRAWLDAPAERLRLLAGDLLDDAVRSRR